MPDLTTESGFANGWRAGFIGFLPMSVGLAPWALVTGLAMVGHGLTPSQAMGMNLIVFAGTAQLGTLPLLAAGAPLWLIVLTALAVNLRFLIFSAAIARGLHDMPVGTRWFAGHLLTDGAFAFSLPKMLAVADRHWRLGYYLAPALWSWLVWQVFALIGVFAADVIPPGWSLNFMAIIALLILLVPMARQRPMLVAALAGAGAAVLLHDLPLRLGTLAAICIGIAAGFAAERLSEKAPADGAAT